LMGGLRKAMPWTFGTFTVAALSLAGIWPLSGFWSKDEILAFTWDHQRGLFILVMITVFMTAFYIFRALFMTFTGEYRGGAAKEGQGGHSSRPSPVKDGHGKVHLHESPWVMVGPMLLLAVLAIFSGLWNVNGAFGALMGHGETRDFMEGFIGIFSYTLPWVSLLTAGSGIFLAYAMYGKKWVSAEKVGSAFKPLYTLFSRKYYFDELYEDIIVRKVLLNGLFAGFQSFDNKIIDGAVNGVANSTIATGKAVRQAQTGQLQLYGMFIGIGVLAIILVIYFFG